MPVVKLLRDLGHDVLTSLDAGNANQRIPDDAVLAFAITQNRILLTINRRDFIKLYRLNPIHAGIIVCTENPNFPVFADLIHTNLIKNKGQFENQLFRINKPD